MSLLIMAPVTYANVEMFQILSLASMFYAGLCIGLIDIVALSVTANELPDD